MSKKLFILTFIFSIATNSFSQKELCTYEVVPLSNICPTISTNFGRIVRTPLTGGLNSFIEMHKFDVTGIAGYIPKGKPFLASNGKLYGMAGLCCGSWNCPNLPSGTIFEYDLVLDKYRVISNDLMQPFLKNPVGYFIEPIPGILYGTSTDGNAIFKFNISTDIITLVGNITTYNYNNGWIVPKIHKELMLATDGNLYGPTLESSSNVNGIVPRSGGIVKINLTTNAITVPFAFGDSFGDDVSFPTSTLVEGLPGKLYGVANGGVFMDAITNPNGCGVIYEYSIATNTISKKIDFDVNGIGQAPSALIRHNNNTFAGTLYSINTQDYYPNKEGSIYEYNFITNQINVLHVFDNQVDGTYNPDITTSLLKGTDNNFYGTAPLGLYRFDPSVNTVIRKTLVNYVQDTLEPIEICRKPSYQEITTSLFTPCIGENFIYNIQNTNATTYVWKKNGVVMPLQTTAILNIATLATSDNGVYTCTMTNECGTTVTMPLQINASCLSVDQIAGTDNRLSISPNPTKNFLNIKLPDNKIYEVIEVTVTNMLGQKVLTDTKNFTKIDVSKLAIGIYEVTLKTNMGDWNEKFIKE